MNKNRAARNQAIAAAKEQPKPAEATPEVATPTDPNAKIRTTTEKVFLKKKMYDHIAEIIQTNLAKQYDADLNDKITLTSEDPISFQYEFVNPDTNETDVIKFVQNDNTKSNVIWFNFVGADGNYSPVLFGVKPNPAKGTYDIISSNSNTKSQVLLKSIPVKFTNKNIKENLNNIFKEYLLKNLN
jgi:hypothetical protein